MGPIGAAALSLVSLPLLAWISSPEVVAVYSMFTITLNLAVMLLTLGLDQSLVRLYYEKQFSQLFLNALLPGGAFFLLLILLFFLFDVEFSETILGVSGFEFLLVVGIAFSFFSRFFSLVLRMENKALEYSFSQLLPKICFLIVLYFLVFFKERVDEKTVVLTLVFGCLLVFVYQFFTLKKILYEIKRYTFNKGLSKQVFIYGLPLFVSSCSYYLLTISDRYFIKEMLSLDDLAKYAAAIHFSNVIFILQSIFVSIWPPMVYRIYSNEKGDVTHLIARSLKIALLFMLISWAIVGVMSYPIVKLLPVNYQSISSLIPMLVAVPILCLLTEITGIYINLKGKTYLHTLTTILALALNLVLNYFLIPEFGLVGGAIATLVAFYFLFIVKTELSIMEGAVFIRLYSYGSLLVFVLVSVYLSFAGFYWFYCLAIWLFLLLFVFSVSFYIRKSLIDSLVSVRRGFNAI